MESESGREKNNETEQHFFSPSVNTIQALSKVVPHKKNWK